MEPKKLDDLLNQYRVTPLPGAPGNLNANVWREIRLRQRAPVSSAFDFREFLAWFRGSTNTLVAPALALTLFVSVSWTALTSPPASSPSVQQALGLQVFSHEASPLTRLTQTP